MSFKYGKPYKNKQKRRDPRYHSQDPDEEDHGQIDYGSNQENIKKLKSFDLRKALENPDSIFESFLEEPKIESKIIKEVQSRTSYSDEETEAGVDDEILEALFDISQDMAHLLTGLSDKTMQRDLMDPVSQIQALAQDFLMYLEQPVDPKEDSDYEFTQGFEENRSRNRAEIDE